MYQALYRKWRPRAFADVVGQEHITETLRRQVDQSRLSHAYLFTGTRGTGKTTCAKILSKAVNCHHPVNGDPCNQCPACLGIDNGSLLDVLELDAASNNGVDHVRALRDEAIYSPAQVKYRVYIVDEVHMLSTAAFNALLKILEEPPAHLIFILATTELNKVPATILSRCQRFAFKRIQPGDIASRLLYVAQEENLQLLPDAAELLSRLSDGALRDALSLLDQCGAAGGTIDTARVLDVLGLAGNVQTAQLMEDILNRDVQAALLMLHQLYSGGKDVGALLGELSTLCRDLLIRMTAPEGGAALLSGGFDTALMDQLSGLVTPTRLIYMATTLQNVAANLPLSANRRTDAELCVMRLCDESLSGDVTALAARLERLEAGGIPAAAPRQSAPTPRPAAPQSPPRRPAPPPVEKKPLDMAPPPWEEPAPLPEAPPWDDPMPIMAPPPEPEPMPIFSDFDAPPLYGEPVAPRPIPVEPPAPKPSRAKAPGKAAAPAPAAGSDIWRELIERYKERLTPMYWFMLDDAVGTMDGDMLVVHCGDDLTMDTLNVDTVTDVLKAVTSEKLGCAVSVRYTLEKPGAAAAQAPRDRMEDLIQAGSKFENFIVK